MSITGINNQGNIQSYNSQDPPPAFRRFSSDVDFITPPLQGSVPVDAVCMRNNFPPGTYPYATTSADEIIKYAITYLTDMQTQLTSSSDILNWVSGIPSLKSVAQNLIAILPNALNLLNQARGFSRTNSEGKTQSDPYVNPTSSVLAVNTILDTIYNMGTYLCSYGNSGSAPNYSPYTNDSSMDQAGTTLVKSSMFDIDIIGAFGNPYSFNQPPSGTDQLNLMISASQSAIQLLLFSPLPLPPVEINDFDGAFKSALDVCATIQENYTFIANFPSISNDMIAKYPNNNNYNQELCDKISPIFESMHELLQGFQV